MDVSEHANILLYGHFDILRHKCSLLLCPHYWAHVQNPKCISAIILLVESCYSPSASPLIRAQTGHGRRKNVDGGAGGGY